MPPCPRRLPTRSKTWPSCTPRLDEAPPRPTIRDVPKLNMEVTMFEFSSLTIALLVGAAFVGMLAVMISVASSRDKRHEG